MTSNDPPNDPFGGPPSTDRSPPGPSQSWADRPQSDRPPSAWGPPPPGDESRPSHTPSNWAEPPHVPPYQPRSQAPPYQAPRSQAPPAQQQSQAIQSLGQPPGYVEWYVESPAKKRRLWLWLLLGLPLLGLLGIGGCSAVLYRAVRGPIDATNDYVAKLDNGDLGGAYDSLCSTEQASFTEGQFIAATEAELGDEITGYRFSSASITNSNGAQSATVRGRLEIDGVSRATSFNLIKEAGEWRVCD